MTRQPGESSTPVPCIEEYTRRKKIRMDFYLSSYELDKLMEFIKKQEIRVELLPFS